MQIRATSIQYKSRLKQKEYFCTPKENLRKTDNPSELHKEILQNELRIKKQQLGEIIGYKTQGAIKRSKVKWYNEGERNTKYFHSLEKRHFNSKTIRNLVTDNGTRNSIACSRLSVVGDERNRARKKRGRTKASSP